MREARLPLADEAMAEARRPDVQPVRYPLAHKPVCESGDSLGQVGVLEATPVQEFSQVIQIRAFAVVVGAFADEAVRETRNELSALVGQSEESFVEKMASKQRDAPLLQA